MRKVAAIGRILLGLIFTVFGLDYFLHFMPEMQVSKGGGAFLEALFITGYMFPAVKLIEIVSGLLLLSGRFAPLAISLLAPITFNIALYHIFLDANGREIALVVAALEILLLWAYRANFKGLLQASAQPGRPVGFSGFLPKLIEHDKVLPEGSALFKQK